MPDIKETAGCPLCKQWYRIHYRPSGEGVMEEHVDPIGPTLCEYSGIVVVPIETTSIHDMTI